MMALDSQCECAREGWPVGASAYEENARAPPARPLQIRSFCARTQSKDGRLHKNRIDIMCQDLKTDGGGSAIERMLTPQMVVENLQGLTDKVCRAMFVAV